VRITYILLSRPWKPHVRLTSAAPGQSPARNPVEHVPLLDLHSPPCFSQADFTVDAGVDGVVG
jgi:hypothetical protein